MKYKRPPSEWAWAGVNLVFVVVAAILFFSIEDPVKATYGLAGSLIAGEVSARLAARWARRHLDPPN